MHDREQVLNEFMDRYMEHEKPSGISILDLAAGSGEATEVRAIKKPDCLQYLMTSPQILLDWRSNRWPSSAPAKMSLTASNPPAEPSSNAAALPVRLPVARPTPRQFPSRAVARPVKTSSITSLPAPTLSITAADPFTSPAYHARTGLPCLELSFADVAAGKLPAPDGTDSDTDLPPPPYDIVVISFALHLVETSSELWALLTELGNRSRWLVVTAPHKKPDIKPNCGWTRWDPSKIWAPAERRGNVGGVEGDGFEIVLDRVRLRVWRSEAHWEP